ncbi:hypothetical protein HNQ69_000525 [Bartonella callosciuri]|uniref:Uncharacterized protein n=1 Tax=Bartonella callosciuri TaxID=686223 RepID=A0A840NPE0_9HYPH|nr:hypothetical protein [Bartonella callosciuri]
MRGAIRYLFPLKTHVDNMREKKQDQPHVKPQYINDLLFFHILKASEKFFSLHF